MRKKKKFVPALKYTWLNSFFDPLMRLAGLDKQLAGVLLSQAKVRAGETILDFGCGTGTLAVMIKEKVPEAKICGVDIDPDILRIARDKAKSRGCDIMFCEYNGVDLPYAGESFDQVVSSLVFHHLPRESKVKALKEIYRLLKYDGKLHILDFGKAGNIFMRSLFLSIQLFDGFATTKDNVEGFLPSFMEGAGFSEVSEVRRLSSPTGNISLYKAVKMRK